MKKIRLSNIPEISAIYFSLLQCGYDYYSIERSREHNDAIRSFIVPGAGPAFFSGVRQDSCQVYPYWPRAAILETAMFYLLPDRSGSWEYGVFRQRIMAASNIADEERDQRLWSWIQEFPAALSQVLESSGFKDYQKWLNAWIDEQNAEHEAELRLIQECLDACVRKYGSSVRDIQICIDPIKCVWSADYHLIGGRFVFSSGRFRADSVIHEFLHHVIHPVIGEIKDTVLSENGKYPGIDRSYYLDGSDAGKLNAFEEYAVRKLTKDVMADKYPECITPYLIRLAEDQTRQ